MSIKSFVWFGIFIGGTMGSFIPMLWGESAFSMSSIIFSGAGSLLGVWGGWKVGKGLGM